MGRSSRRRLLRSCAVVLAGTMLGGCWWVQAGFDSHRTGYNPFVTITPSEGGSFTEAWRTNVGAHPVTPLVLSPRLGLVHTVVGRDLGDRPTLISLELATGVERWTTVLDGVDPLQQAAVVTGKNDDVFVGYLGIGSDPVSRLERYDARTGDLVSSIRIGDPGMTAEATYAQAVRRDDWIVVSGLYVTPLGPGGVFTVVDLTDPGRTWTHQFAPGAELATNPIIVGDRVYFGLSTYPTTGSTLSLVGWDLSGCEAAPCAPSVSLPLPPGNIQAISASGDGRQVAVYSESGLDVVHLATGEFWSDPSMPRNSLWLFTIPSPTWTPDALLVPAPVLGRDDQVTLRAYDPAGCGAPTCDPLWVSEPVGGQLLVQPAAAAGGTVVLATSRSTAMFPTSCTDPCPALGVHTSPSDALPQAPSIVAGLVLRTDAHWVMVLRWSDGT